MGGGDAGDGRHGSSGYGSIMKIYGLWLIGLVGTPVCQGVTIEQYHSHDFSFSATITGNPFDADLRANFDGPGSVRVTVPGFYDGNRTWKIRFSTRLNSSHLVIS